MAGAGGNAGGQSGAAGGAAGAGGHVTDGGTSDGSPACPGFDASNLASGLVSWWKGEGNGNDSAGLNNGTLQNVTFVPGRFGGQAFNFDGQTSAVVVPSSTTLDVATGFGISLWIKVPSWPSGARFIVNKWVYSVEDKDISLNENGQIGFFLYATSSGALESNATLTLNTWHHVAATYDGTTARLYIDGVLDASAPATGDVADNIGSLTFAHNAVRGAQEAVNNGYLTGAVDEIRWYNRTLSASEIGALHAGCE
jgi:hypothetical protein